MHLHVEAIAHLVVHYIVALHLRFLRRQFVTFKLQPVTAIMEDSHSQWKHVSCIIIITTIDTLQREADRETVRWNSTGKPGL